MMGRGEIPYIKRGRRYFVKKADLDAYMEKNRQAYQEYVRWRAKQSWPHGDSYQEHCYYNIWLEETGRIPERKNSQ